MRFGRACVLFVRGCAAFYIAILTPGPPAEIHEPIDWTDGTS